MTDSFEAWAYRTDLLRQVAALERQRLIERKAGAGDKRIYRLTPTGRLHALGGRDPQVQWSRKWDGHWRLVLFDVPTSQNTQRSRLRRYLRHKSFGFLQNSVWITPDSLGEEAQLLRGAKINVESMILLQARPCAGESDADIVAGAWDFDRINRLYNRYLEILTKQPVQKPKTKGQAKIVQQWAEAERMAWREAVEADPLLPEKLLPPKYLGRQAWQQRIQVLRRAGRDLHSFKP